VEAARAELECATDSVEKDRAVERLDVAVQRLTAFVLGE
jgi:hypothetical protein